MNAIKIGFFRPLLDVSDSASVALFESSPKGRRQGLSERQRDEANGMCQASSPFILG